MHKYAFPCQQLFFGLVGAATSKRTCFALHCLAMKLRYILFGALLALALPCLGQQKLQSAVDDAMRGRQGTAIVLDLRTNKIIASHDLETAARRVATPGSTMKTFVLIKLLETGKAKASERYVCPRYVRIAGKRLDCAHPDLPGPIDPMDALAWSCNAYFAVAARRLTPAEVADALRRAGVTSPTGWVKDEALGTVSTAASEEQLGLQALGEWGVMTTPLALLKAYAGLAGRLDDANVKLAWQGMEHSVAYGMARAAQVSKVRIAGKTGTAAQPGSATTHGWFVGLAPAEKPEVALVIYVEHGRGLDAAALAKPILAAYFNDRPRGPR